jgi:hypothetical protein
MSDTHPDLADWIDHVRGLGTPETRATLEGHLAGCAACRSVAGQFAEVAAVARLDAVAVPSAASLRVAESIHARFRPDPVVSLPRLVARLLGGGPIPALAGFRGPGGGMREGTWQAGPYGVRVRVERERETPTLAIVGQVAVAADAGVDTSVAGLPVLLTTGRHVVSRTDSNAFGEFVLACEPAPRLRLQVAVAGASRRVEVPLSGLLRGPAR